MLEILVLSFPGPYSTKQEQPYLQSQGTKLNFILVSSGVEDNH